MIEKKTIEVTSCDVCGVDDRKAQIGSREYLCGMGYKPSNDDPLAQKFKKLYIRKDICDRCYARMDHNFLSLSTEEKEQIVYMCLAEHDNQKDLRSDPQLQETERRWPPYPFTVDSIDKMDKMNSVQDKPTLEEKEFNFEGEHSVVKWPSY